MSNLSLQPPFPQLNGIFILNKPAGPSSAKCLSIFKKLGQKKIGHAGTLDPMATGILIVLLGAATKLSAYILADGLKTYKGVAQLGIETNTWDIEGDILSQNNFSSISPQQIITEVCSWHGEQEQEIPAFSAAKFNGQPLYKLARKGKNTPVKTHKINILKADVLNIAMPFVTFRVSCASGTYIRSLAHSLGKRLRCGAALCELTREYSHPFDIDQACALNDLQENPDLLIKMLKPLECALPGWPLLDLTGKQARDIRNGKAIEADELEPVKADRAILCENGNALALAELSLDDNCWKILRGLWR